MHDLDAAVDLSEMGLDSFTPYIVERHSLWILLPVFGILILLLHLKKTNKNRSKP